jgi:hypothetical protein
MSSQQSTQDNEPGSAPAPQDHPAGTEGHGGHGSESALQHMRAWEQRRSSHTGGTDSERPD